MSNENKHIKLVSLWEMSKVETIEEFYHRKFDWIPYNIRNDIGHFNIFQHEPVEPDSTAFKPIASSELLAEQKTDDPGAARFGTQNWAPIALADGKLLIRDQSRLMCVKVAE